MIVLAHIYPVSVEVVLHEGVGAELERAEAIVARLHVDLVEHLPQERLELVEVLLPDAARGIQDEDHIRRLSAT